MFYNPHARPITKCPECGLMQFVNDKGRVEFHYNTRGSLCRGVTVTPKPEDIIPPDRGPANASHQ